MEKYQTWDAIVVSGSDMLDMDDWRRRRCTRLPDSQLADGTYDEKIEKKEKSEKGGEEKGKEKQEIATQRRRLIKREVRHLPCFCLLANPPYG